jgi:hypothetical protein
MITLQQIKSFLNPFKGATASSNGKKGLVPQPKINQVGEWYLNSNGNWKQVIVDITNSLYQYKKDLTSPIISLENEIILYTYTPTANTTFTFDTSALTINNRVLVCQVLVNMGATLRTLNFTGVTWINNDTPVVSQINKKYLFAFLSVDNGASWVGNLQGWW